MTTAKKLAAQAIHAEGGGRQGRFITDFSDDLLIDQFRAEGPAYKAIRRSLDLVVSTSILLLCLPLIPFICLLVKLDSPGPVLFRHTRIGVNRRRCRIPDGEKPDRRRQDLFGRPFTLYKFRTMYSNAPQLFPDLYRYIYDEAELSRLPIKALVSNKHTSEDPRVPRIGRWLRRTSLDELPNFINVLRGDMHLVGPRPDIRENIRYYSPLQLHKLDVKPGLTGLAQIQGRGNLSFQQTNDYDLEYVETRSLLLDLKILLKTIVITVKATGAY
ncbi:MAG: hypothetical protein OJF47_000292 [Nitrospira sp.]|jgi:lipopolysaccharide/colanic/teichoic acid biosynthesis glycosyltransferase|nr:MAG: hypothetical protein OJF47_000292 [Nitrospira sp.]